MNIAVPLRRTIIHKSHDVILTGRGGSDAAINHLSHITRSVDNDVLEVRAVMRHMPIFANKSLAKANDSNKNERNNGFNEQDRARKSLTFDEKNQRRHQDLPQTHRFDHSDDIANAGISRN